MTDREKLPRFTIVVPTRARRDTLESTLATCTDQGYERLEIVVCDNLSLDGTEEMVRSIPDERIRCVNPGRRLSMASNWEFALGHVRPGFVMVLGDDDGMIPHAVKELVDILSDTGCEAIGWEQAIYTWPGCPGDKIADRLKIPLNGSIRVRDAARTLASVLTYRESHKALPSLYWGAVHTDVIDRARATSGRYVNDVNPDIYSAVSTCMVVDRFVQASVPFSIMGLSRHSTGVSFRAGETGEGTQVATFFEEADLEVHEDVPMVPAAPAYTTEAYLQARDHVPGGERFPRPDFRRLLEAVVEQASTDNDGAHQILMKAAGELAARHGLADDLRRLGAAFPRRPYVRREAPLGLNLLRDTIKLDCAELNVVDVHEASKLAYYTLKLYQHGYLSPAGVARSTMDRARSRAGVVARQASRYLSKSGLGRLLD